VRAARYNTAMPRKTPCTVLGATGVVGQRFVARLARHPWFEIAHLTASGRSAGKRYRDACAWRAPGEPYGGLGERVLDETDAAKASAPVVFSALDAAIAREVEPAFAAAGSIVFSNASAFRMENDVPLLLADVDAEHLALVETQRARRKWRGAIVCNPNCTAAVVATALAPLHARFGVERFVAASFQSVSGAGYPGVASLDALGNVVPFIGGEEDKVERETAKMLGRFEAGRVVPAAIAASAACHRVPVLEGHGVALSIALRGSPGVEAVREALASYRPAIAGLALPSAPRASVVVHDAEDRPQARLDVDFDGGMPVHVGRIRSCPVLGIRLFALASNLERGAAGASVMNAEWAAVERRD
jgi:aspartate-semialdehyde dehydrogenase